MQILSDRLGKWPVSSSSFFRRFGKNFFDLLGLNKSPAVLAIIGVNGIVLLATLAIPHLPFDYGLAPALVASGEWYRLITSIFVHGSVKHLLTNSVMLAIFGPTFEKATGSFRFLLYYLIFGLGSSIAFYQFGFCLRISAGSSGAVYGLVAASLPFVAKRDVRPILRFLIALAFMLALVSSLAQFKTAHLGGLAVGVITGIHLNLLGQPKPPHRALGMFVLSFLLLAFAYLALKRTVGFQCP